MLTQKLINECVYELKTVLKAGATIIYYFTSCYHWCLMQLNLSCDVNGQWNLMVRYNVAFPYLQLTSPCYYCYHLLNKIRCNIGYSFASSLCYIFKLSAFIIHCIKITFGHFVSDNRYRPRDLRWKVKWRSRQDDLTSWLNTSFRSGTDDVFDYHWLFTI